MATTVPTTANNCGRLMGYTWGELSSRTWGNLHQVPYGIQRAWKASLTASQSVNDFATSLNEKLEQSNLFQLSELTTLFGTINSKSTELLNALE